MNIHSITNPIVSFVSRLFLLWTILIALIAISVVKGVPYINNW